MRDIPKVVIVLMVGITLFVSVLLSIGGFLGWLQVGGIWSISTGWSNLDKKVQGRHLTGYPLDYREARDEPLMTWLGQGSFRIMWQGKLFLVDPVLSSNEGWMPRMLQAPDVTHLGKIDAVLITADAPLTLSLKSLLKLEPTTLYVPADIGEETYRSLSDKHRVLGIEAGKTYPLGNQIRLTTIDQGPAVAPIPGMSANGSSLGLFLQSPKFAVYLHGAKPVRVNLPQLNSPTRLLYSTTPIPGSSPSFITSGRAWDVPTAVDFAKSTGSILVIPTHFGTFRTSFTSPSETLPEFHAICTERAVTWVLPIPGRHLPQN